MYLLFLVQLFVFFIATEEYCLTPAKQKGKCVPLAKCPSLLSQFSNTKGDIYDHLHKFKCGSNHDDERYVCCRLDDLENFENIASCGMQNNLVQENSVLHLSDFPWLVKILITDKSHSFEKLACTGVVIHHRYILYSAQCHYEIQEQSFFVRIDYYNGQKNNCNEPLDSYTKNCSDYDTYEIDEFIIHPYYDQITKSNGLAIMKLSRRIKFSEFMSPICLPLVDDTFTNNNKMYTSGWNHSSQISEISVKTSNSSTSITNSICEQIINNGNYLSPFDICTINRTNTDDNSIGYPMMSLHQSQWYLVGFTSRGIEPQIHTRVQTYLPWIKNIIGEEKCLTPSNELGECVQLTECPRLMAAFANVNRRDENYLKKFVCKYEVRTDYPLTVCCGYDLNFTIATSSDNIQSNFDNILDNQTCGIQNYDSDISMNEKPSKKEFPWLAAILNGKEAICPGSLITDRYVLTSAQCSLSFYPDDIMLVRLGAYDLKTDFNGSDVQEYEVIEVKSHPFYNAFQFLHDVALLRLEHAVTFTEYVRPICLPTSEDNVNDFGRTFYMSGFGDIERTIKGPSIKKKIVTSLLSLNACKEKAKQYNYANAPTEYQICTELFKNSTDTVCLGDAGGPAMYSKNNQWFIEGISSSYGCTNGEPVVNVKVFKYLKWIKSNIQY